MNEILYFTQVFGPVLGLILYMLHKQISEIIHRRADAATAESLTRIEESLERVEDAVVPKTPEPVTEGQPDVAGQPQT